MGFAASLSARLGLVHHPAERRNHLRLPIPSEASSDVPPSSADHHHGLSAEGAHPGSPSTDWRSAAIAAFSDRSAKAWISEKLGKGWMVS